MITIQIDEETYSTNDMAYLLRKIADHIERGTTRGFCPNWNITGDEEE